MVCVHGLGASHRYWLPVARELAADAHVVALDLPGFGRTPGPDRALDVRGQSLALADWLRVTGRGGATLMGNSLGCQVIVDLATHSPDLVGPVVLVGPTMDRRARSAPRQGARLVTDVRWERPSLVPLLARDYAACGARRYAATLRHALADPVETKLAAVPTRAVVVRGARDVIVPARWAREVADGLARGRLVEVPGVGHVVNWSAPRPLAAVVRSVLG
ncbi:MAG: alpha/beta hydrolase [Actinomycetota bacterium]|nr:alpha/beta hydrolase [Actinomycetota bacterium]